MKPPVRFVFGVHVHQPVGNFDHVFADHARDVYHPLVAQIARRRLTPALLHISGPLLEWIEAHDTPLVDRIGRLVTDGAIELLLSGMYEPILTAIPRADRVEQIAWHREALRARFGVAGGGLWLTERVWEPDLAHDLAKAGVEYVLVDDRHFLVTGLRREDLHVPFRTEHDGQAVSVLAIDERLRHLIPFKPPADIERYFREAHDGSLPLAVFADDGEKFGGWPGTHNWVYERGWFDQFCDMLERLQDEGIVKMATGHEAVTQVPCRGPVYLPTASYQEMEAWALPPEAGRRLAAIEHDLGAERMAGPDRSLVRGAHWRNFFVKYSESNRLHKKMESLSRLSRSRGDPRAARRAIARAQCNDAYWHGVFGGLYLPHLRSALWRELAVAERVLRAGAALGADVRDFDCDGASEAWIHSGAFSAMVAPVRGAALVELLRFDSAVNYADVLTRRLEAYHLPPVRGAGAGGGSGAESIHDREALLGLSSMPPIDLDDRAIGVARVIAAGVNATDYGRAAYTPVTSWARTRFSMVCETIGGEVVVTCECPTLAVEWRFDANGAASADYRWDGAAYHHGERFAPEISLAHPIGVEAPEAVETWRYVVDTVAKSERGIEAVVQGQSVTPLFDASAGHARLLIR